jgi:PadR family transcriptional regulator PadR
MIEELGRHGYKVSAGTLYPILHGLEEIGIPGLDGGADRARHTADLSRHACRHPGTRAAKLKMRELFGELFEDEEVRLPST